MTRLLIVEDEQILSLDLTRHLEDMGYKVVGAVKSGAEAIDAAVREKPELILMDIRIQGDIDGFETAKQIRKQLDIAIIFMTAFSDEGTFHQAKVSGGYGYIQKPIRIKELQTNIDMVIERHTMQRKVKDNEARYKNLIETIPYGIVECTSKGIISMANTSMHTILGFDEGKLGGNLFFRFLYSKDDIQQLTQQYKDFASSDKKTNIYIAKAKTKSGRNIDIQINWNYKRNVYGKAEGIVASITDITAIRETETLVRESVAKANYLEYYDSLTGLPNRKMMMEQTHLEINRAEGRNRKLAILCLGLDKFKNINQLHNQTIGDSLLRAVGQRMRATLRDDDLITRLSGDKFGVICCDLGSTEDVIDVVLKLNNLFIHPFTISDKELKVTCSIGISIFPSDGEMEEILIKNSETAMDMAKASGGDRYFLFDRKMNQDIINQIKREGEIQEALLNNEFIPYFQPKMNKHGEILGIEALVRWNSSLHKKIISPFFFIGVAEKNGLIIPLGNYVLEATCKQIKNWIAAGYDVPKVAVNISPSQFRQESLIADIQSIITNIDIPTKYLEFEITETGIMENEKDSIQKLHELHNMGISISVDDFGTGYSSLSKLKDYPIDYLKIDKSFIDNITVDKKSFMITTTIIDLAHNLNYQVVAEGVETLEQLNLLIKHDCDQYQGYYFSKPVPANEVVRYFPIKKLPN